MTKERVYDALTGVVYQDDAQVVYIRATKEYVGAGTQRNPVSWGEPMSEPGVYIEVQEG